VYFIYSRGHKSQPSSPEGMFSDAKNIFLKIVIKQFFSCRKIFFLAIFFFLQENKNCAKRKKSCGKKKHRFVTISRKVDED